MNITKLVVITVIIGVILAVNYKLDIFEPIPLILGAACIMVFNIVMKRFKSKDK
ncbi:hypothetical protein QVA72_00350 [Staphylococcus simulans]|uniref:hypothetical protein n=1 Tax=Staphylococcus simulans TaxID=1286 RepID=UPI00131EDB06|nr:hypothetical protein [Staphylococcus simulans]MDU0420095.1 hypothetical protein [Staphylococcus simulans]MDU0465953.1 hypothetical protein [Staphylococcus simulans]